MVDFSSMSPEDQQALVHQLIAMSTADQDNQGFDEQLQQARALQQPASGHHVSALGATLGGLGDVVRTLYGNSQAKEAQKGRAELQAKQLASRENFVKGLFGAGKPKPADMGAGQPVAMGDMQEAQPFGYGGSYGYVPGQY